MNNLWILLREVAGHLFFRTETLSRHRGVINANKLRDSELPTLKQDESNLELEGSKGVTLPQLSCVGATVLKPQNDILVANNGEDVPRQNEDAFRLDLLNNGTVLCAVSDGAGGEGTFCGEWARSMLGNLPSEPIKSKEDLSSWLLGIWQTFYESYSITAKVDSTTQRKFLKEGSLATLSAFWICSTDNKLICNGVCYGDSPVFLLRGSKVNSNLELIFPEKLSALDRNPHLINWKTETDTEYAVFMNELELFPGDKLIITTDGIGRFLALREISKVKNGKTVTSEISEGDGLNFEHHGKMAQYIQRHKERQCQSIDQVINEIIAAVGSKNDFKRYTLEQFELELIENDDCTVLVLSAEDRK